MNKNKELNNAKRNKCDEFYTQYENIEKEIESYIEYDKNLFKNKTILLPCDDYEKSNFTKYFKNNFNRFGIKKLISTSYNGNGLGRIYTKEKEEINYLKGNGDFASNEISLLKDSSDFIFTNPPFSLFRKFFKWISEKKFSILGNSTSIGYKEIFPYIKENKVWLGKSIHSGDRKFTVLDTYSLYASGCGTENGEKFIKVKGVRWFTNIPFNRSENLILTKMFIRI